MSTLVPYSRRTADIARWTPACHPLATADERAPLDCPGVKEVMVEIGAILAVHLAVAVAIILTLLGCGVA